MAKGDDSRARNRIDYEANRGQTLGENLRTGTLLPQLGQFRDYFGSAANQQMGDYSNLMSGYNEFAKTGGFSPTDIANLRARAVSPVRASYANANREVNRGRALQGGYSPGFNVLRARMAREQGQAGSEAATNAEAALAGMKQQGKLAGLQGGASLYGTTPGMTSTFSNAVLNASGQLTNAVGNEMGFANDVSRNQIAAGQLPGKSQSVIGNIAGIAGIGQQIAGMAGGGLYPWLGDGTQHLMGGNSGLRGGAPMLTPGDLGYARQNMPQLMMR